MALPTHDCWSDGVHTRIAGAWVVDVLLVAVEADCV